MKNELFILEHIIEKHCGMSIKSAEKVFIKIMKLNLLVLNDVMKIAEDEFFKIKDANPLFSKQQVRLVAMFVSTTKMNKTLTSGSAKGSNNHEMRKKSKLNDKQVVKVKRAKKREHVLNRIGDIERWRKESFSWREIAEIMNKNCLYEKDRISYRHILNIYKSVEKEKPCSL